MCVPYWVACSFKQGFWRNNTFELRNIQARSDASNCMATHAGQGTSGSIIASSASISKPAQAHMHVQASNDEKPWTDLYRCEGDGRLKLPGQFASWTLPGHAAGEAFSSFRIFVQHPESGPHPSVHLSHLELYGYLFSSQHGWSTASKSAEPVFDKKCRADSPRA